METDDNYGVLTISGVSEQTRVLPLTKKFFTSAPYLDTPTPSRLVYPHPWLPLVGAGRPHKARGRGLLWPLLAR